ncbi:MAG TPA: 4Fe-4S binding protein [Thermoanaerobacterales bacterium]|nr:4Fe-4S binding protein [Thermoanaerobacterales bacterium]
MALINYEKCVGCGNCIDYCPLEAISLKDDKAHIDQDICTNCYVCIRNKVCPVGAIERPELNTFIEQFQHIISDPTETTAETGVPGRGTEESKTNDVTGRVKKGEVGICIDMGRPGIGCRLRDVEKVAMAVTKAGLILEDKDATPLAMLMEDNSIGKIKDEYLDTNLLSIIIEGKCSIECFPRVIEALKTVEKQIDTVFSLGVIVRVDENGNSPILEEIEKLGLPRPYRGKVNVGLGRPLITD